MTEIEKDLTKIIEGDVRFDDYSRALYSTDASIYDITPIGVVLPKNEEDVTRVVKYAFDHAIPILPRGGGSSLSGQAIGKAIILDFTKYMNRLLEVCPEEKWVRVQPGLIYDELNLALKSYGLKFGPDPASGNRAAIGGMIGNNSTGAHSILYGMTADHIRSLRVVLSNGQIVTLQPTRLDSKEYDDISKEEGFFGRITNEIVDLSKEYRFECENRYPKIRRNVAGYNLRDSVKDGTLDLCRLVCGSEGTLVTVLEATLNLVDFPKATGMIVLCFRDLENALKAVAPIMDLKPSALEVVDEILLDLAKSSRAHGAVARSLPEDARAALLVEFYGTKKIDIQPKIDAVRTMIKDDLALAFDSLDALEQGRQAELWSLRKAGLPILMSKPGDEKPTAFVEDTAVPPENLPQYISEFLNLVKRYGTTAAVYGHAGGGCLHIRPVINLKKSTDIRKISAIAEEITKLVIKHGGTTASEHGDGLARTQWLQKLYGQRLIVAFKKIKNVFDPKGIMNPGKIVNFSADLRNHLRYRPNEDIPKIRATLNYENQIDLVRAIDMCNGCGECRNKTTGVMCPSFRGANDEITSTRGRANLMRQAIYGDLPQYEISSKKFKEEVLDLCLGCKACKRECPSGVDLAKLKTEFKYQYIQEHGLSAGDILFGHLDRISQVGSALAPITNRFNKSVLGKFTLEKIFGIDRRRDLPEFRWMTFQRWFNQRPTTNKASPRGKIAFFYDCFLNHNHPEVGKAAIKVLEKLGFEVVLADRHCCGRTMLSAGLIDDAREAAIYNVHHLSEQIRQGYDIVGCEPSCMVTIQDEYKDLIDSADLKQVESHTFELMEYLHHVHSEKGLSTHWKEPSEPLLYHGHCYQKATGKANYTTEVLNLLPGSEVIPLETGCCGMAGAFGFERKHYDLSMNIAELMFEKIQAQPGRVVVSGASCAYQIENGLKIKVKHPAQILAENML